MDSGDTQWYIESSAQWYMANHFPYDIMTYPQAGAIVGNPQLALWHSFSNEAPEDPGAADGRPGLIICFSSILEANGHRLISELYTQPTEFEVGRFALYEVKWVFLN